MNNAGTPENLIPAHPGNTNATSHGAHSPRLVGAAAAAIEAEMFVSCHLTPDERIAVGEVSNLMAMAEMIDRYLSEKGPVDKKGNPNYLIDRRLRISRQLKEWLVPVREAIQREANSAHDPATLERSDFIRELQLVALGKDASVGAREKLIALIELLRLDERVAASASTPLDDVDAAIESILNELTERRLAQGLADDQPVETAD